MQATSLGGAVSSAASAVFRPIARAAGAVKSLASKGAGMAKTGLSGAAQGIGAAAGKVWDFTKGVGSAIAGAAGIKPLGGGVHMGGLQPNVAKDFMAMAAEYNKLTGKNLLVTDAFRSYEEQVKLKQEKPGLAATPGKSMHGFGVALDIDSKNVDELDKLKLLGKYGFIRPMYPKRPGHKYEPWHIEPAAIQGKYSDVMAGYKPPSVSSQVGDAVPYNKEMQRGDIAKNEVSAQMMPYEMMAKANASGAKGFEDFGKKITSIMTTNMNVTNQILSKGMSNTNNQGASQGGSQDQMLRDILEGNLLA